MTEQGINNRVIGIFMGIDIIADDNCPKNTAYLFPDWVARKLLKNGIIEQKDVTFCAKIEGLGNG